MIQISNHLKKLVAEEEHGSTSFSWESATFELFFALRTCCKEVVVSFLLKWNRGKSPFSLKKKSATFS
jgi:hypothetical protein